MKPVFDLIALYHGYFTGAVVLLCLLRIVYFDVRYQIYVDLGYLNKKEINWSKHDDASKWIVRRFGKIVLFTLVAITTFPIQLYFPDYIPHSQIPHLQAIIHILLGVLWFTSTLFTIVVTCECLLTTRNYILGEIRRES